jgi:hypothetical protein
MRKRAATSPPRGGIPSRVCQDTKEGPTCLTIEAASEVMMWSSAWTWQEPRPRLGNPEPGRPGAPQRQWGRVSSWVRVTTAIEFLRVWADLLQQGALAVLRTGLTPRGDGRPVPQ